MMNSITMENFRCFRERQTVRLAPLTLLVGENSTGKTSFLALVRALWDMAYELRVPDFKEAPFDLGSFDEIAHHRGARGSRADSVLAGFTLKAGNPEDRSPTEFLFSLANKVSTTVPDFRRISHGKVWIEEGLPPARKYDLTVGTQRGRWHLRDPEDGPRMQRGGEIQPPGWPWYATVPRRDDSELTRFEEVDGSVPINEKDISRIIGLVASASRGTLAGNGRPFAAAPVRSKPHRTYDRTHAILDPEGDYVPTHLADVRSRGLNEWSVLKKQLQDFGRLTGLFDEFDVKQPFGSQSGPFQIRVRKSGGNLKGPWRNFVDVGYGVSQALPVLVELLEPDAQTTLLLQQPEVHLHPMAQAALGTLFCQVAGTGIPRRQLIVETHSDHLINRVRMDVRDEVTDLRPDEVMVLYFERNGLEVKIHQVTFDELGNVDAPASYGKFFMEETHRTLWPLRRKEED